MGLKSHVFDHETRKSRLFPCYRPNINDFLLSYNQNLKIDIFTPLQRIPCYCKSRLGTLRLNSWWRVTNRNCKTPHNWSQSNQPAGFLQREMAEERDRLAQQAMESENALDDYLMGGELDDTSDMKMLLFKLLMKKYSK